MAQTFTQKFNEAKKKNKALTVAQFKLQSEPQSMGPFTGASPKVETPKIETPKVETPVAPPVTTQAEPTFTATDYTKTLQDLGFSGGTLKSIQETVNKMSEETAQQRLNKKKAQEALSGLSSAGTGYFENPYLETSSDALLADITAAEDELFKTQEEDKTYLEQQIEAMNKVNLSEYEQSKFKGQSATSGMAAEFLPGREGPVAGSAAAAVSGFQGRVTEQLTNAKIRLDSAMQSRARQLKELEKAQKDGNDKLATSISNNLAQTGKAIQDMRVDLENQQAANTQKAMDFIGKMAPGSFQGMDLVSMSNLFGGDMGMAQTVQNLDTMRFNAQISSPDYIKSMNEAMTVGMTAEQKNFLYYQKLLKSDAVSAQAFAQKAGFADTKTAQQEFDNQMEWNDYALKYYQETFTWPSRDGVTYADGSVDDNVPVGSTGGQCGEYVNNYFGAKIFGDTLASKMENNNSDIPVAGGAFISKYGYNLATIGQTGHTGLVTKVYEDGSFDIKDSNRNGDEMVDTSHVTDPAASGIIGFFDPAKTTPKWNPNGKELASVTSYTPPVLPGGQGMGKQLTGRDAIMAQIKSGLVTPTDATKYRKMAEAQGWLDEYIKAVTDPKVKPLSPSEAAQYGVPSSINQYQLDEILAYRKQQGLGNQTFQSFVNDKATDQSGTSEGDKLMKFVQLRENLQEAKDVYKLLQEEGGGISGWWDTAKRVTGRVGESVLGIGQTNEQKYYRQLDALTGEALVSFVKEISGVAVSEPEFQRLKRYKPNVDMTEDQFTDQLDRMISEYEASAKAKAKRFGFDSVEQMNRVITGEIKSDIFPDTPQQDTFTLPDEENNPF